MSEMKCRHDCEICYGRGRVRLPIYQRAFAFNPSVEPTMEESSREYPCPECTEMVAVERVQVVRTADSRISDPEFQRHVRNSATHALVKHVAERDFVRFENTENASELTRHVRATLGVVSPSVITTLEERIAERQDEVATEVVQEASRKIRVWASHFSGDEGWISKGQAVDAVNDAFKAVMKRRAAPPVQFDDGA